MQQHGSVFKRWTAWLWGGLMIGLGLSWPSIAAQDKASNLVANVQFIHIQGLLDASELAWLLAQPDLKIELSYEPQQRIEGVTVRRTKAWPFGTKESTVTRYSSLIGADIQRSTAGLRFEAPDRLEGPGQYRLHAARLQIPMPQALGRPQPDWRFSLFHDGLPSKLQETRQDVGWVDAGAFALGLRMEFHWSGADPKALTLMQQPAQHECSSVRRGPEGRWLFEPRHTFAGLKTLLSSKAYEAPRQASHRVINRPAKPLPQDMADLELSRHHLVELRVGERRIEYLSLYGERKWAGTCVENVSFDAMLVDGEPIDVEHKISHFRCNDRDVANRAPLELRAAWLDDATLADYRENRSGLPAVRWKAFLADRPQCLNPPSAQTAPPFAHANFLRERSVLLREAFLP